MYPQRELTQLAAQKVAVRWDIALRRAQCVAAVSEVSRPLAWLDRALKLWRKLSPFLIVAAVPLGMVVSRLAFSRWKILGALLRWGPLLFGAVRGLGSTVKMRHRSSR